MIDDETLNRIRKLCAAVNYRMDILYDTNNVIIMAVYKLGYVAIWLVRLENPNQIVETKLLCEVKATPVIEGNRWAI